MWIEHEGLVAREKSQARKANIASTHLRELENSIVVSRAYEVCGGKQDGGKRG